MFINKEIAEERLNICKACDEYTSLKICKACNCFMPMKVKFKNKFCPIDKWGKVVSDAEVAPYDDLPG